MFILRKKHSQYLYSLGLDIEVPLDVRVKAVPVGDNTEDPIKEYCVLNGIDYAALTPNQDEESNQDEDVEVHHLTFKMKNETYEIIFHTMVKLSDYQQGNSSNDDIILNTLLAIARREVGLMQRYRDLDNLEVAIERSGFVFTRGYLKGLNAAEQRELGAAYAIFVLNGSNLDKVIFDNQMTNRMMQGLRIHYVNHEGSSMVPSER